MIEFICDYRGKLTGENFYKSGGVASFDAETEQLLIARGVAIDATPAKSVTKRRGQPAAKSPRKRTARKKKDD